MKTLLIDIREGVGSVISHRNRSKTRQIHQGIDEVGTVYRHNVMNINKPFHIGDFADGKFNDFPSNRVRLRMSRFLTTSPPSPMVWET